MKDASLLILQHRRAYILQWNTVVPRITQDPLYICMFQTWNAGFIRNTIKPDTLLDTIPVEVI